MPSGLFEIRSPDDDAGSQRDRNSLRLQNESGRVAARLTGLKEYDAWYGKLEFSAAAALSIADHKQNVVHMFRQSEERDILLLFTQLMVQTHVPSLLSNNMGLRSQRRWLDVIHSDGLISIEHSGTPTQR